MLYKKEDEQVKAPNTAPVRITELAEAFKEDLYNLYEVYRPERERTSYYIEE